MKLFLSCAGNFQSQSLYKNWPKSKQKTKNKSRDLHKDCVILMMAYAIHSNVKNLGLFFFYDKVGISK